MSLDLGSATGVVSSVVLASGGLLAWASRIAENRGKRHAEKVALHAEERVSLEGLNDRLQKLLDAANARADHEADCRRKAEEECEGHKADSALWRDAYDDQTLDIRALKVYARTAYADCLETRPGYPPPPILAPRPDPMTLKRRDRTE